MSVERKQSFFKITSIILGIELFAAALLSIIGGFCLLFGINATIPSTVEKTTESVSNGYTFLNPVTSTQINSVGIFLKFIILILIAAIVFGIVWLARYIFMQKNMSYQQLIKRKRVYLILSILTAIGSLSNILFAIFIFMPFVTMYVLTEVNNIDDDDD